MKALTDFLPFAKRRRIRVAKPDLIEQRDDKTLLVWGDVPHWLVGDQEMGRFLIGLDGSSSLHAMLSGWDRQNKTTVVQTIQTLLRVGVAKELTARASADRSIDATPTKIAPMATTRPVIESIAINLTRRCNLRCRMCYGLERLGGRVEEELSAAELGRFLRQVRPLTSARAMVVILGGEPLLEPAKLIDLARLVQQMGMGAVVSTNGLLITPQFAADARKVGLQVQVSLDGATAATHESLRGRESFAKTILGVKTLVEAGVFTILSLVCHRGNLGELEAFFGLANSLGIRQARFIPLKKMGGAVMANGLETVGIAELMRAAYDLFRLHPEYVSLLGRDAFSILANTCQYSERKDSCGTGRRTLLLDADGTLYPCLNLDGAAWRIGQVREQGFDLRRTWESAAILQTVRRATALDDPARECSRCPVRYWCLGGCRGETCAAGGDLGAVSPACADWRRAVLDMMWMLAERPDLVRATDQIC